MLQEASEGSESLLVLSLNIHAASPMAAYGQKAEPTYT